MYVNRSRVTEIVKAPYIVEQLCAGEHAVRTGGEKVQQLDLLRRRIHALALDNQIVRLLVDHQIVKRQLLGRIIRRHTAEYRTHARNDLRHFERLDDVVVRTHLQTGNAVRGLAFGRQHDDRHITLRTDLPADRPAVHHRHHHVEQQHVRLVGLPLFDALHAVFRLKHRVAFALQIQAQQLTDVGLVLYDQYLLGHSSPLLSQFNLILL